MCEDRCLGGKFMDRDSKGKFIKGHKKFSISKKKMMFLCEYCSKKFEQYPSNRREHHIFCSRKCCYKFKQTQYKYEIEPELLLALYWGNEYSTTKISKLFGTYPSNIFHRMKTLNIPLRTRIEAGKLLNHSHLYGIISWNNGKTYIEDPRIPHGENHSNWKGGISTENEKLRKSVKFKEWRKAVFKRDGYCCKLCHDYSKKGHRLILHSHHIKSWANFPEDRFKVDNGITLCKSCHIYVTNIDIINQQ